MSGQSPARPVSDDITPLQQMVASCSGAILTSLFGEIDQDTWKSNFETIQTNAELISHTRMRICDKVLLFRALIQVSSKSQMGADTVCMCVCARARVFGILLSC